MVKSKANTNTASANPTSSQRLSALLDEGSGDAATDARLRELVDFWAQVRRVITVNTASMGLEELDEVAAAILLQDDAPPARLTRTVLLLTPPDAIADRQAAQHAVFAPPAAPVAPARVKRSSGRFPPISAKPPPVKKRKETASLPFDVPADTPMEIIADVRRIQERAAAKKKTPAQLAYLWHGKRAWYEPADHEDLHLLHWRFIMRHRTTFFLLALYARSTNSSYRRSLKPKALQARLRFLSANIEEFGWFGFMDRLENSVNDTLLWLGGKPAKHSSGAKDNPKDGDLASLLHEDPARYREKIERMLDPLRIDADVNTSIPKLLEETHALDPTHEPHQRFSDRALVRMVVDINNNRDYRGEWVGNQTSGPWKELITFRPLHEEQQKVSDLIKVGKRVATFRVKPFKTTEKMAEDSYFKVLDIYTVLAPTIPFTAGGPHFVPDKKRKVRPAVTDHQSNFDSKEDVKQESDEHASGAESEHCSDDSDYDREDDEKDNDDDEGKPTPSQTADTADEDEDGEDEANNTPADKQPTRRTPISPQAFIV